MYDYEEACLSLDFVEKVYFKTTSIKKSYKTIQ
jgi:hypothetical protein